LPASRSGCWRTADRPVTSPERPPLHAAGPVEAARALGSSVLALLRARVELLGLELEEGKERGKRALLLGCVAALFLALGLLLLAFLVVVFFWDTHRLLAVGGVTLLYLAIGIGAAVRLRAALRDSPPPFSATLAEFRKDLDMIRGHDE
jgi:uncharacterized membrane protein YqjE